MAQYTLTEKSALAENSSFRSRLFQALFSKANYHRMQTPQNLKQSKQQTYALNFLKGGANSIDIHATTRFWLANYNADPPELDGNNQPSDNAILNTQPLDVLYDALAGVVAGDENISL